MNEKVYDVAIIGSGPSGLTAAIYTTRADLSTVIIGGLKWGGQLMLTTLVENFPGFPEGVMGPELMMNMRKQAEHFGAAFLNSDFKMASFKQNPIELITADDKKVLAKTVLIATGADTKWLDVPGEQDKIGRGVSSCAPCDAAFYRGKRVLVIGGGDAAMEEASVLAKFAEHVWLVHRREELRASAAMQNRVFDNDKVTFVFNTQVTEIMGDAKVEKVKLLTNGEKPIFMDKDQKLALLPEEREGITLKSENNSVEWEFPVEGVFVAIGHIPNTKVFPGVDLDEKGYVKVYPGMKTNVPNVYVAGDVHDHEYRQAVTAAGYGCMAALEIEKALRAQAETQTD